MRDMFTEEVKWVKLIHDALGKPTIMQFLRPSEKVTQYLKPLYLKAFINGKPISRVFIDGRVVLNVMPILTLKKLGKYKIDLISTNMKMTNFTSDITLPWEYW